MEDELGFHDPRGLPSPGNSHFPAGNRMRTLHDLEGDWGAGGTDITRIPMEREGLHLLGKCLTRGFWFFWVFFKAHFKREE